MRLARAGCRVAVSRWQVATPMMDTAVEA
jgi:hypothetical protein